MFKVPADFITYNLMRLLPETSLAKSVNFFIDDTLKIAFFIILIISIISFLRTYISPEKIREWLAKERFGLSYILAAGFGAITPFCSCSGIPIFIGFLKAGVPMGVAFSFLVTSPLVNEIVFVLMLGTFGPKMAVVYAGFGILLGVICGAILQRTGLQQDLIELNDAAEMMEMPQNLQAKLIFAYDETKWMLKQIFPFMVLGVLIGSVIHGYLPNDWVAHYVNSKAWWAVPIAVLIGVPLYVGCSTLVPIIFAFTLNGVAIGTALAFMMAAAGLSLPEAIILKSVMKWRLLLVFFGIVTLGIIAVGYLFNWLF
ncbi:permease [Candidatus Saganbacteria bacterium]|nr:permease [Candidatus Saganbacteria bacterium]